MSKGLLTTQETPYDKYPGMTVKMVDREALARRQPTLMDGGNFIVNFLARGGKEAAAGTDAYRTQQTGLYDNLINQGGFGGGARSFGMSDALTGALQNKISSQFRDKSDMLRNQFQRETPFDFAKRMGVYQSLASAGARAANQNDANEAAKKAAKKAKKGGLAGAIGGVGGALVGGLIGGPVGAQVGAGAGTIAAGGYS